MEKNTQLTQELEECKTRLKAVVAGLEEPQKASSGNTCLDNRICKDVPVIYSAWFINLTKDFADNHGENPKIVKDEETHVRRQLKAGERVLTQLRQEKNNLQDANIRLSVELADV